MLITFYSYILFMRKRKIIVFDIDCTLLFRSTIRLEGIKPHYQKQNRFVYFRPYLNILWKYIQQHMHLFTPILWSRMMKKNAEKINAMFQQHGIFFQKFYDQTHCQGEKKMKKDLRVISQDHDISLHDILLVDDSPEKRVEEQNFLHIKPFEGIDQHDEELLKLLPKLEQFIECTQKCMGKKSQFEEKIIKYPKYIKSFFEEEQTYFKRKQEDLTKQQEKFQDPERKVVVFDVNKTLLIKNKIPLQGLQPHGKISGEHVYLRPYFRLINEFIQDHKQNTKFIAWTTMDGSKRIKSYFELFKKYGVNFHDIIGAKACTEQKRKDLSTVCDKFGSFVNNAILIDDSEFKRVGQQNFLKIKKYTGEENDIQILNILEEIDKFIKCEKDCTLKKIIEKRKNSVQYRDNKIKQQIKKEEIGKHKPEAILRPTIVDGRKIRHVVFDLNETIFYRTKGTLKQFPKVGQNKIHNLYMRPNLKQLFDYLQLNAIQYSLWTTITAKNTKTYYLKYFSDIGVNFKYVLAQEDLIDGKKDLEQFEKISGLPLHTFILVDDNPGKKVPHQNFIQICPFNEHCSQQNALLKLTALLKEIIPENLDKSIQK